MNDSIACMLDLGPKAEDALVTLCGGFLDCTTRSSFLSEMSDASSLQVIEQAYKSLGHFCKAICHVFNVEAHDSDAGDVMYFVDYVGSSLFEKTIKGVLKKEGSFWAQQVEEIIRTGATAAILKPKHDSFLQSLDKLDGLEPLSLTPEVADHVSKMVASYKELRSGIRAVELQGISKRFQRQVQALVKDCMECDGSIGALKLSQVGVEMLQLSLELFAAAPGILGQIKEFKAWSLRHKGELACNNFAALIERSMKDDKPVDFPQIKNSLRELSGANKPKELLDAIPSFVRKMLDICLTQARYPTPDVSKLKLDLGILDLVQKDFWVGGPLAPVMQFVEASVNGMQSAVLLRSALNKLEAYGSDSKARMAKDKGDALINTIRSTRCRCVQLWKKAGEIKETLVESLTLNADLEHLFEFDVGRSFADNSDLMKSEVYTDILAHKAVLFQQGVKESAQRVESLCRNMHAGARADWKVSPSPLPDCAFQEVFKRYDETLYYLDGAALKAGAAELLEAGQLVKHATASQVLVYLIWRMVYI